MPCCTLIVVDKWGYLWTGSGAYLYDGSNAAAYSVLRFDTGGSANPIRVFQMNHKANVRICPEPLMNPF